MSFASKYIRTDMASEACPNKENGSLRGIRASERTTLTFPVTEISVTSREGEEILGKPVGDYLTVSLGKIWLDSDERRGNAALVLGEELKKLIYSFGKPNAVLVVGLGNRYITSDAIGPLTVKGITPNRHIRESDPELFEKLGSLCTCALTPGVSAQTGLEALDTVKGALEASGASVVIVIDALASKSVDRLGTTVQLSNTGIKPGSGIGNARSSIDKDTLGVPVISLGVPTVVNSSTLVCDILERAGVSDIPPSLHEELENGRSFFVTLKDADTVIKEMSYLLSEAINYALSV